MTRPQNCSLELIEINDAARFLQAGGILLYPTETFWAIGCRADSPDAIEAIYTIKGRFQTKPLPLLACGKAQVEAAVDLSAAPAALMKQFWPGPLTLILPALIPLGKHLLNPAGKAAVRVTASTAARMLTRLSGALLTCSSANIQAHMPGTRIEDIDEDFWQACARASIPTAICNFASSSGTNVLPSTIIEPERTDTGWKLHIVRPGAITIEQLNNEGWEITT